MDGWRSFFVDIWGRVLYNERVMYQGRLGVRPSPVWTRFRSVEGAAVLRRQEGYTLLPPKYRRFSDGPDRGRANSKAG